MIEQSIGSLWSYQYKSCRIHASICETLSVWCFWDGDDDVGYCGISCALAQFAKLLYSLNITQSVVGYFLCYMMCVNIVGRGDD